MLLKGTVSYVHSTAGACLQKLTGDGPGVIWQRPTGKLTTHIDDLQIPFLVCLTYICTPSRKYTNSELSHLACISIWSEDTLDWQRHMF